MANQFEQKTWDPRVPASTPGLTSRYCGACGVNLDTTLHHPDCPTVEARRQASDPEPLRIDRETMFFEICETIRNRSTCRRGRVGCVIVKDSRIVSMGYNGAPPGAPHCIELGCDTEGNDHESGCQRSIHAEANAIAYAARVGTPTEGGTLYTTHAPCLKCAQLIVSAGIKRVLYRTEYRLPQGLDLLRELGVAAAQWMPQVAE